MRFHLLLKIHFLKGYTTEEQDVVSKLMKKIKWKAFKITMNTVYAMKPDEPSNKKIGQLYDLIVVKLQKNMGGSYTGWKNSNRPKTKKLIIWVEDPNF